MEGRQSEYSQSGLSSSYPTFPGTPSEDSSADQASAAQYTQGQDPRANNFSATPAPNSEYAGINNPTSARSGSFPEYIQRAYQPPAQGAPAAAMAQSQSPSMPLQDALHSDSSQNLKSDSDVPIDPSIASATSPTYPTHGQYSPYGQPQGELQQQQQHHPGYTAQQMYPPRGDWPGHHPGYSLQYGGGHGSTSAPPGPSMVSPVQRPPTVSSSSGYYVQPPYAYQHHRTPGGHPLSTVYSFVPIPGAQQHKRPRRRYEEIERMYKCGWNGCEKAYGTLNHLNAHVTMQSHGVKRTPEEFKEIRKEWKAKKKEEEQQRKAEEEARIRGTDGRPPHDGGPDVPVYGQPPRQAVQMPQATGHAQLPPIGYQPAASGNSAAPQYGSAQSPGINEGINQHAYPQSPYTNPQMYQPNH